MNYKIVRRGDRKNLAVRWHDGERWRERSAGTTRRREAERIAKDLINESSGLLAADDWLDFKDRYVEDRLKDSSQSYRSTFASAARKFEELTNVERLSAIDTQMVARFRSKMETGGYPASTVASYLKHLRSCWNWAHRHGYMPAAVSIDMPAGGDAVRPKGSALVAEQFERLIAAVPKIMPPGPPTVELQRILWGYWLSGLRLRELLLLTWDDPTQIMLSQFDVKTPKIFIPAPLNKGRRDVELPLLPDFLEHLQAVPHAQRTGRVYRPVGKRGRAVASKDYVGGLISDVGKASGVIDSQGKSPTTHDLRRSFATRMARLGLNKWALKALMRHRSIETTERYYIGLDADQTAEEIRRVWVRRLGDTLGDSHDSVSSVTGRKPL